MRLATGHLKIELHETEERLLGELRTLRRGHRKTRDGSLTYCRLSWLDTAMALRAQIPHQDHGSRSSRRKHALNEVVGFADGGRFSTRPLFRYITFFFAF